MKDKNKFYLTASIDIVEETDELKKEVASVIDLPEGAAKQIDLSYFSAILVSSGENLNHAFFLGSELVAARDTVVSKALDIEHEEQEIIGHIYSSAFTDLEGERLSMLELSSTENATLDSKDMHIQIGSVMYKNRFPEIAKEIAENKYCVSMECYYKDFDIKIGNTIISKDTAQAIGIEVSNDNIYGKFAKLTKDDKEVASGTIARVLRGICFSGCGIVKNPANPASVILEVANKDVETLVFDLDHKEKPTISEVSNNVTSKVVEEINLDEIEEAELNYNDSVGICVSYKRRLEDKEGNITAENWCTEFSQVCTSDSRDASDQGCLRNKAVSVATSCLKNLLDKKQASDNTEISLKRLKAALTKASKFNN